MIKNLEELKRQLQELADIVNAYKSEAVQLRVVELVFGSESATEAAPTVVREEPSDPPRQSLRESKRPAKRSDKDQTLGSPSRNGRSKLGARGVLNRLYEAGFFKNAKKTIGEIVQHSETNLATKIKQSDISGPLAGYVRDGKLKRSKNAENQYEYVQE